MSGWNATQSVALPTSALFCCFPKACAPGNPKTKPDSVLYNTMFIHSVRACQANLQSTKPTIHQKRLSSAKSYYTTLALVYYRRPAVRHTARPSSSKRPTVALRCPSPPPSIKDFYIVILVWPSLSKKVHGFRLELSKSIKCWCFEVRLPVQVKVSLCNKRLTPDETLCHTTQHNKTTFESQVLIMIFISLPPSHNTWSER